MLLWLVLFLTTFVGAGYIAFQLGHRLGLDRALPGRNQRVLPAPSAEPTERTLAHLRPGDVLQTSGRDWLVEGLVHYEEDGSRWRSARSIDGRDVRWVYVGLGPAIGTKPLALDPVDDLEVAEYPPDPIRYQGHAYQLARKGAATTRIEGDVSGLGPERFAPGASHRCRYWHYAGPAERTLVIEQWGEHYRALHGVALDPHEIEFLPGS